MRKLRDYALAALGLDWADLARFATQQARRDRQTPLAGASAGRLTADWLVGDLSTDEKIRQDLRKLRDRSRDLATNNPYMIRFLQMADTNVIGPQGIRLDFAFPTGQGQVDLDRGLAIVQAWKRWGKMGIPTVDGTLDFLSLQSMLLQMILVDGEVLLRRRVVDNGFGFALQVIEADWLDHTYNKTLSGGREIRLGIEYDVDGRPLAYWLRPPTQQDVNGYAANRSRWTRIPAEEILHLYMRSRFRQSRGIPKVNGVLLELRHVGAYRETAVISARMGAAKMGFLQRDDESGEITGETDADRNVVDDIAPGEIHQLPPGVKFQEFNPGYPTEQFGTFNTAMLRGIAVGLGVNYNGLASDLEGVNFSSMRAGALEDRDVWRTVQSWVARYALDQIFAWWLPSALLNDAIPGFSMTDEAAILEAGRWQPRGWAWVEPLKDAKANEQQLANNTRTRDDICSETGADWRQVMLQQRREQDFADSIGLELGAPSSQDPMPDADDVDEPGTDPQRKLNGRGGTHHVVN